MKRPSAYLAALAIAAIIYSSPSFSADGIGALFEALGSGDAVEQRAYEDELIRQGRVRQAQEVLRQQQPHFQSGVPDSYGLGYRDGKAAASKEIRENWMTYAAAGFGTIADLIYAETDPAKLDQVERVVLESDSSAAAKRTTRLMVADRKKTLGQLSR